MTDTSTAAIEALVERLLQIADWEICDSFDRQALQGSASTLKAVSEERDRMAAALELAKHHIRVLAESGVQRLLDYGVSVDPPERTYGPILQWIDDAALRPVDPAPPTAAGREALRGKQ